MSTIDELAEALYAISDGDFVLSERAADVALAFLADQGKVVLGPDGEPLVLSPLLRALGLDVLERVRRRSPGQGRQSISPENIRELALIELRFTYGITGPLAHHQPRPRAGTEGHDRGRGARMSRVIHDGDPLTAGELAALLATLPPDAPVAYLAESSGRTAHVFRIAYVSVQETGVVTFL